MFHLKALVTKLKKALAEDLAYILALTFIARAITAIGALLLLMVIGRLYGPTGVGAFALGQSLLIGAGLLANFGMNNSLMRFVGQQANSPQVLRYLSWACQKSLLISIGSAFALWLLHSLLEKWFRVPGLGAITIGIALAVPGFTFSMILAGFFKGAGKPATACLQENGAVALVAAALILVWAQWKVDSSLSDIGFAYAVAAWLVAFQGCIQLLLWVQRQPRPEPHSSTPTSCTTTRTEFNNTSRAFFLQNLAGFMQQVLSIIIAGWLLNANDLGLFRSAQQLGTLIAFILIVINAVFPPRFAAMHRIGDQPALSKLARQGALIGTALSSPLMLVCLLAPKWTLSWFGSGFEDAATMLRVIAIAQLVNVATGSVGFLLSMTGHERLFRNITLICNGVGLLAFTCLIKLLGPMGAALALAFILVSQNLAALVFVWKKLGIWMLPIPNVLAWLKIETDALKTKSKGV